MVLIFEALLTRCLISMTYLFVLCSMPTHLLSCALGRSNHIYLDLTMILMLLEELVASVSANGAKLRVIVIKKHIFRE